MHLKTESMQQIFLLSMIRTNISVDLNLEVFRFHSAFRDIQFELLLQGLLAMLRKLYKSKAEVFVSIHLVADICMHVYIHSVRLIFSEANMFKICWEILKVHGFVPTFLLSLSYQADVHQFFSLVHDLAHCNLFQMFDVLVGLLFLFFRLKPHVMLLGLSGGADLGPWS